MSSKNIIWMYGPLYYIKPTFSNLVEKFSNYEIIKFDDCSSFLDINNTLSSYSCFSDNRLIIFTDLPSLTESEKKKLKALIENLPSHIYIIFYMMSPEQNKFLFSSVEKVGKLFIEETSLKKRDVAGWVNQRCTKMGLKIEEDAVEAIVETCPFDDKGNVLIDALEMIILKMQLFDVRAKSLNRECVINTSSSYETIAIWDFVSKCDSRDYESLLNFIEKSNLLGKSHVDGVSQILFSMYWKYKLLLFLKEKSANKITGQDLVSSALSLKKINYVGTGFSARVKPDEKGSSLWSNYSINSCVNPIYGKKPSIEVYSRKELYILNNLLHKGILLTRGCDSDAEALLIANTIIMVLCNVINYKTAVSIFSSVEKLRNKI